MMTPERYVRQSSPRGTKETLLSEFKIDLSKFSKERGD
jgi:hypothetical protein